ARAARAPRARVARPARAPHLEGVPGPWHELQPRLPARAATPARRRAPSRAQSPRERPARGRASPRGRAAGPGADDAAVPARAVGRDAAAGDDRDGPPLPAEPADRGRADDGARRDARRADPPAPAVPPARARFRRVLHQPRPRPRRRLLRPGGGPVRRSGDRVRACRRAARERPPSLHEGADRRAATARPAGRGARDRVGQRAGGARGAARLRLRAALPNRRGGVPDRAAAPHPDRRPGRRLLPVGRRVTPLLDVRSLVKEFPPRRRREPPVRAVDGVDLALVAGEVYGLVGESGSGKTTVARCILGLAQPTAGTIVYDGLDLGAADRPTLRRARRELQLVFQQPAAALDPRMTVSQLVAEPLRTHGLARGAALRDRIERLLAEVGLSAALLSRYPHELSGGQCQRVVIARALSTSPRLLVLDEPTSALDVVVQAQILNLLLELRAQHGLSFLLISHDLGVVGHLSDRIGVMYLGRLVEEGPAADVLRSPKHPYTL